MGVSFEHDDLPQVETVPEERELDEEAGTANEEAGGENFLPTEDSPLPSDNTSVAGSVTSVSEHAGSVGDLPPFCFIGPNECRRIFELADDKGKFYRVCGNGSAGCRRHVKDKGDKKLGDIGCYPPVKARACIDGREDGFRTMEEHSKFEKEREEAQQLAMMALSKRFGDSPSGSEEKLHAEAPPGDAGYHVQTGGDKHESPPPKAFKPRSASPRPEATKGTNWKRALKDSAQPTLGDLAREMKPKPFEEVSGSLKRAPEGGALEAWQQTLQQQGLPTGSVDPSTLLMLTMMEKLSASLGSLSAEAATSKKAPTAKETTSAGPEMKSWYAVGKGLDGRSRVCNSWAEAAPLVNGVSGAIHQRFGSEQEAIEFANATRANLMHGANGPEHPNNWHAVTNSKTGFFGICPKVAEAQVHVTGVSGACMKKFHTCAEAQNHTQGYHAAWQFQRSQGTPASPIHTESDQVEERNSGHATNAVAPENRVHHHGGRPQPVQPPAALMGLDPSAGKESKLFGVNVEQDAEDPRETLLPPDLSESAAQALINGTIDSVALPGGLSGGGELEAMASDVGMLGEALEELVMQNRGSSSGRQDLRWRHDNRTSLGGVKTLKHLHKRLEVLRRLLPDVVKRMKRLTVAACKRSGWRAQGTAESWGLHGCLPAIVVAALRDCIALHEWIAEVATASSWNDALLDLNHHVDKMRMIRTLADSRTHAICEICCYLRNAREKKFFSSTVQQARNNAFLRGPGAMGGFPGDNKSICSNEGGEGGSGGGGGAGIALMMGQPNNCCMHCRACLHLGGKDMCPWTNQDPAQARKNGAKAVRKLAEGTSARPRGGGKNRDGEEGKAPSA